MNIERQIQLENESVNLGIQEYRRKLQTTDLAEVPPGILVMKKAMDPLVLAIRQFKLLPVAGGRLNHVKSFMRRITVSEEEMAYLTLRGCLGGTAVNHVLHPLVGCCISIAEMVIDQHEYNRFKRENPGYLHTLEKDLKSSGRKHRQTVVMLKKRKLGIEDDSFSKDEKLALGQKLIELCIETTGLVEKFRHFTNQKGTRLPQGQTMHFIRPTEAALEFMEQINKECELMAPVYLPTVIPPKPWTSPTAGAYYTNGITRRLTLVKTTNKLTKKLLVDAHMPQVYSAVNAIQETAWRVNSAVLDVLNDVWSSGGTLGGLPARELEEMPTRTWSEEETPEPDVLKAWKRRASDVYDSRVRSRGKRVQVATKLRMALKFKDESAIYYPHCLDFRGRIYPIPACGGFQPQGDDVGKALLMFANGKALGDRGAFWLMVHIANCYGYDKVSFDDRVKWVKEHEKEIIDSAENPLDGQRFWVDADSPYCFLAAGKEYVGYLTEGRSFVSHLPIAMDGTCNGLQNFSGMLLDAVGGAAVNLVPCEKPQDIYSRVATVVSQIVEREATEGNEMAALWVGKIDRKMAKRNVMTLPYGAKKYGFKDQLLQELGNRDKGYLDTDDLFKPAVYLAHRMYEGIGTVVIAARQAMDWLQEVSLVVSKLGQPIRWSTPAGFPALQDYRISQLKRIDTFWGGMRVQLGLKKDTDKLDSRKQASAISPNFVHSLDASHLMLTVNACRSNGITSLAMIHDSYGSLACEIDTMNECLREAFVTQYRQDVLEKFRDEVLAQIPEELHPKVPPIPPKGTLDLNAVKGSRYFFA